MEPQDNTNECHHPRSLSLAISFLDAYQPLNEEKATLVNRLRDRVRNNPSRQDVLNLAAAVDDSEFRLRRGSVRKLPALARRIRESAPTTS